MKNNGRDELWDSATWADLDKAVSEEVKRSRVARKVFHTEDVELDEWPAAKLGVDRPDRESSRRRGRALHPRSPG